MRLLLPISILLLLGTVLLGQDSKTVKTDKIEGIICTNFADWKFMVTAKEFWTPTKEDVLKAEGKIEDHLKVNSVGHAPDLWRKLPDYQRQYIGIVVSGHKRIFCNFFCSKQTPLTERPVFVFDGGECFFRIEYDLDDQKCYNFNANGYGQVGWLLKSYAIGHILDGSNHDVIGDRLLPDSCLRRKSRFRAWFR